MLDTFLRCLIWFSVALSVVAGVLGLVRYRRLTPNLRWLALLAGFDAIMELFFSFLMDVLKIHNLFLVPFVVIGEVAILAFMYRQVLQLPTFSRVVPWLVGLFSLYALLQVPLKLDVVRDAVSLEVISDLVQISLAGLYFQKLLNELRVEHLRQDPFFWLSVALAAHGLGDIFISLFNNYLLTNCTVQLQKIVLWGVRNLFNILLYLAYILALWMRPQPADASRAYSA